MRFKNAIIIFWLFPISLLAQNKSGYYIDWNVDYTERIVKPAIPISQQEARVVNSYLVSFDEENRFTNVKYFYKGKPSQYASYGAFQLTRNYLEDRNEDSFKNEQGEPDENREGVFKIVYHLNAQGYWVKKEHFNIKDELVDVRGPHSEAAAISLITRDASHRLETELRLNSEEDTVPDINGFKFVHFGFNNDGYITYRKFVDEQGNLKNGPLGYAQVNFQCNENGSFFEEEFRDESYNLKTHPILLLSLIHI